MASVSEALQFLLLVGASVLYLGIAVLALWAIDKVIRNKMTRDGGKNEIPSSFWLKVWAVRVVAIVWLTFGIVYLLNVILEMSWWLRS